MTHGGGTSKTAEARPQVLLMARFTRVEHQNLREWGAGRRA